MPSPDSFPDQQLRLDALRAFAVAETSGVEAALASLGPPVDGRRLRATLSLLLQNDRVKDAADLVRDREPDESWGDLAVCALSHNGEYDHALKLIDRADTWTDPAVMRRCRLGFAEGVMAFLSKSYSTSSLLGIDKPRDADIALLRKVLELLDPLLWSVRANRRIQGELELEAVLFAINASVALGDFSQVNDFGRWLIAFTPIPLTVAELAMRALIAPPTGLVGRLRTEHPQEFAAHLLAALVERDVLNRPDDAFNALMAVSASASTESEKESVCIAILETCGRGDPAAIDQALKVVASLRPDDARMLGILDASRHVALKEFDAAESLLNKLRDDADPVWWQAWAQLAEITNRPDVAQQAWEHASTLLPHPDVLKRYVRMSIEQRRYRGAASALMTLVEKSPHDLHALRTLGNVLMRLGDYREAAEAFGRISEAEPSVPEHRFHQALCLSRRNQLSEAMSILAPLCDGDKPPLEALLLRSELLSTSGEHGAAFAQLNRVAADYWDQPEFLFPYVNYAYRAAEDKLAHEAFTRLLQLREEGRVPPDALRAASVEELLEHGDAHRRRREMLLEATLLGRMPWLLAEDWLNNAATWAWLIRTQELPWLSDEPRFRAAYTTYSTNGFSVFNTSEGKRLEALECAGPDTRVVCDLSALLTLHRLGRLETVARYFGTLVLPSSYGDLRIRDAQRLGQHQPSREHELRTLREAIDLGRIEIIEAHLQGYAHINEYSSEDEGQRYRITDLHDALQAAQRLNQSSSNELSALYSKVSGVDEAHPPLSQGARIIIDLFTLRALARTEAFPEILRFFQVHLLASQEQQLLDELRAHAAGVEAWEWHRKLWDAVNRLGERIVWRSVSDDNREDRKLTDGVRTDYIDAMRLASETGLPLLADDRVSQTAVLQKQPCEHFQAFGSDQVLVACKDAKLIDDDAVAGDFIRLMKWRYRFVIPPAGILLFWARGSLGNLPGPELITCAVYVQDCLRDPGLFTGLEQSEPPMPMALKLVTAWTDVLTDFLFAVWNDESFAETEASDLTRWIGEELVPSCPPGLWLHAIGHNLSRGQVPALLTLTMVRFTTIRNVSRANHGLRVLAQSLGVDDERFTLIAAEAIDALRR